MMRSYVPRLVILFKIYAVVSLKIVREEKDTILKHVEGCSLNNDGNATEECRQCDDNAWTVGTPKSTKFPVLPTCLSHQEIGCNIGFSNNNTLVAENNVYDLNITQSCVQWLTKIYIWNTSDQLRGLWQFVSPTKYKIFFDITLTNTKQLIMKELNYRWSGQLFRVDISCQDSSFVECFVFKIRGTVTYPVDVPQLFSPFSIMYQSPGTSKLLNSTNIIRYLSLMRMTLETTWMALETTSMGLETTRMALETTSMAPETTRDVSSLTKGTTTAIAASLYMATLTTISNIETTIAKRETVTNMDHFKSLSSEGYQTVTPKPSCSTYKKSKGVKTLETSQLVTHISRISTTPITQLNSTMQTIEHVNTPASIIPTTVQSKRWRLSSSLIIQITKPTNTVPVKSKARQNLAIILGVTIPVATVLIVCCFAYYVYKRSKINQIIPKTIRFNKDAATGHLEQY